MKRKKKFILSEIYLKCTIYKISRRFHLGGLVEVGIHPMSQYITYMQNNDEY